MSDDRLEREINEILDKIDQFPGPESRRARARKRAFRSFANGVAARQRALMRQLARFSLGQVMLLAFLMILASVFFRRPPLSTWLLVVGVILFVSSFAIMMFSGGGGGSGPRSRETQYWRGREISHRSQSLALRLRRWFASRRRP